MNENTTHPSPMVRGAEDVDLAAAIGRAIRTAMGDELSQSELARRSGIDQPTLSKLVRGVRATPLTVWEMLAIERAAGRPAGWLMVEAGIVAKRPGLREAILSDPRLSKVARTMLLAAASAAIAMESGDLEAIQVAADLTR